MYRSPSGGNYLLARHLFLLCLDHFLDHVATDGTVLLRGKITVVTVLKWYAKLTCYFILKTI